MLPRLRPKEREPYGGPVIMPIWVAARAARGRAGRDRASVRSSFRATQDRRFTTTGSSTSPAPADGAWRAHLDPRRSQGAPSVLAPVEGQEELSPVDPSAPSRLSSGYSLLTIRIRRERLPSPETAKPMSPLLLLALPVGIVAAVVALVAHGLVQLAAAIVSITVLIYIAAAGYLMRRDDHGPRRP